MDSGPAPRGASRNDGQSDPSGQRLNFRLLCDELTRRGRINRISRSRAFVEETSMIPTLKRLSGAAIALSLAAACPAFGQQLELKVMAPAAPGGGWDQTARAMQQALVAAKI